MSNYRGQDKHETYRHYQPANQRVIEPMAAFLLGKELENNPREGVVNLANRAVKDDWQIHLHRHDGLVIDYDNIVGKMWQDLASEAPGRRAFGQLVANSIPINTSGDGR